MMCAEAGIDRRDLFCFGIVDLDLPAALLNWKLFRGRMGGSLAAERLSLILTNSRRDPHAAFAIHREAVRISLTCPDRFIAPIRGGLHWLGIAFTRCLRIPNR